MYYYEIEFEGTPYKTYFFKSVKPLIVNGIYWITADYVQKYNNKVLICKEFSKREAEDWERRYSCKLRTITDVKMCEAPERPNDHIRNVWFNEEKGTTCVEWDDGVKTLVTCQPGDIFSKEFGIALCYMKRMMKNRACYNDVFRKWGCYDD